MAIGLEPRSLLALAPTVDLVVGCADTAEPLLPPGFLRGHMAVLEAGYARETALMREARAAGCRIVDGRDWLLYQGASAFALFTGAAADLPAMRAALDEAPKPGRPGIALIGFMGSGKSRVAAELARRTGAPVEELDARVERRAGAKITEIFARQGEAAFRAMESAELRAALERPGAVLSCGGGAVLDPRNVEALRARCTVVWLWADVPHVLARISDARERPLLAGPDREARARELLTARLPSYAAAADLAIDTAGLTPDSIAEVILDETHRARPR